MQRKKYKHDGNTYFKRKRKVYLGRTEGAWGPTEA